MQCYFACLWCYVGRRKALKVVMLRNFWDAISAENDKKTSWFAYPGALIVERRLYLSGSLNLPFKTKKFSLSLCSARQELHGAADTNIRSSSKFCHILKERWDQFEWPNRSRILKRCRKISVWSETLLFGGHSPLWYAVSKLFWIFEMLQFI